MLSSMAGPTCRCIGLALLICLLGALPSAAAVFRLISSLELREEFSDNVFFDATDEEADWLTTLTPAFTLEQRSERTNIQATARLSGLHYRDNDDLDAVDQNYLVSADYVWSPRLNVNGEVEFQRDSRADRDLEDSGLVLDTERRDNWRAGCGSSFALSERSRLSLSYLFNRDIYSQDETADSDSHYVSLGYSYELSERIQGMVNLNYNHSEFKGSRIDNAGLEAGLGYAASESWNLQALVGARTTRSRYEELVPVVVFPFIFYLKQEAETRDEGWTAQLSSNWKMERSNVRASLQRDVRLASGRTGSTELTALTLSGRHRLTDKLSLTFSGGYYLNQADSNEFAGEAIDEQTLRLSPGLNYRWNEDLSMTLGYGHSRLDDREANEISTRNLAFIRLNYQYPREF